MLEQLTAEDPRTAGPYRLEGRLGSGAMGQVFLGRDPGGQLAAVKVIHPGLADDPGFRARFAREIAAARTVGGRFTAPLVDADPDAAQPWLATAYVDGPSLSDAVTGGGPLPASSVLALAAGLAEALMDIHAAGVVHRDLKPSNVLLAADGPRVIDFGIASAADASTLTRTGLVMGSPGFMSPEQAEGQQAGPASDVFSLGAVLFFAATGEGPFGTGPPAALIYRIVHTEPPLELLPTALRPVIEQCLAKNPPDRPDGRQLLASLTGSGGLPTQTVVPRPQPPAAPVAGGRAAVPVRRRPRLLWASGLIAAAFIGGGLAAWHAYGADQHTPAAPSGGSRPPTAPAPGAGGPTATALPAPVLLSPRNGAQLNSYWYYQHGLTLRWREVRGAADYFVQIQLCVSSCTQTSPNGPFSSTTQTVTVSHYRISYGGGPERWRVAAVGPDGRQGKLSRWWDFD